MEPQGWFFCLFPCLFDNYYNQSLNFASVNGENVEGRSSGPKMVEADTLPNSRSKVALVVPIGGG